MRRIFARALMTLGVLAALSTNTASGETARHGSGTALAVTWEDGTLLLRDGEGFPLVVIGANAVIRTAKGARIALKDIRPGDRVEYHVERWAGMSLATGVRVVSPYTAEVR
jgi:hypothetical protein